MSVTSECNAERARETARLAALVADCDLVDAEIEALQARRRDLARVEEAARAKLALLEEALLEAAPTVTRPAEFQQAAGENG